MSPFRYADTFTPVGSRKRHKNKHLERTSLSTLLRLAKEDLENNNWITQCQRILEDSLNVLSFTSPNVLCLGLGSPFSSRDSRAQLAFLLKICECFNIEHARVSVYDPVFTNEDIALFTELGVCPLTENKHGMYLVQVPTILYMPHCDIHLYENMLKENWTQERISNMLLIANHLSDYVDSNPTHKLEMGFPCLLRLAPHLDSRPIPTSNLYPSAFNNCSVQFVRRSSLLDKHVNFQCLPFPRIPDR